MSYLINGECGFNLKDKDGDCYYSNFNGDTVSVDGTCNDNIANEGNNYLHSLQDNSCYLADSYFLELPLSDYQSLMGLSGGLFGFAFFAVVLYTFSFMGRK